MGRVACEALAHADDLTFAGGFARVRDPQRQIVDDLDELLSARPDVLLDLTTHPDSVAISMRALEAGVRPVIGATGWSDVEISALRERAQRLELGAMLVPNFSIGAILMMKFAAEAARYFDGAEIVELHHEQKKDAPSGTSRLTARRISEAGGPASVPIHSVRLRGMLAHQEVLFGTEGEVLTIRHDSFSRSSFAPGMLAAVRRVMELRELQVGLDA
jgi:4-hydroxy-tetrahydrodipicolinate reductase